MADGWAGAQGRWWRLGGAALLVLAALPSPATAQDGAFLEDAAGDVGSKVADQPGPSAAALYPAADLLGLTITETKAAFSFRLEAADLPSEQDPGADGVVYDTVFGHNGRQFLLEVVMAAPVLQPEIFTILGYRDGPDAEWSTVWFSQAGALVDPAAGTILVEVPRDDLADADGTPPFPGRALDGLRVHSFTALSGEGGGITINGDRFGSPTTVEDHMPDLNAPPASWAVRIGEAQTGHAQLTSRQPFRASNGEATTFVYEVVAHNLGSSEDTFELSTRGVPAGYSAVLPVPVVSVPGGATTTLPVLLTMPFGHQHGSETSFVLEMRSLSDPGSVGRIEMGVRFLPVPQPAGHHDTVYLHQAAQAGGVGPLFGFRPGFMNTLEEDPNDVGGNFASTGLNFFGPGVLGTSWDFALSPALLMGLDLDAGKVGRLSVPIASTIPLREVTVSARLHVGDGSIGDAGTVLLAAMEPTAPVDLMPDGVVLFQGELRALPDVGRIPFTPGTNLWLEVELRTSGPVIGFTGGPDSPYMAPGGFAQLPLREWHDAVDEALAVTGGPALSALGPQERLLNPGEAVVFPVSVANPLDAEAEVRFEVSGANAEWASMPSRSVVVPAHGTAQASVVVRAPADATHLQRADLVLQAYEVREPTARGLLRLVAEVDTQADHPDDSAAADGLERKDSPGLGLLPLAAALAMAAVLRRRR